MNVSLLNQRLQEEERNQEDRWRPEIQEIIIMLRGSQIKRSTIIVLLV